MERRNGGVQRGGEGEEKDKCRRMTKWRRKSWSRRRRREWRRWIRGIARETETAGLPGLRRLSVIPCVSHPVPGASTQVEYLRKRVYIRTHWPKNIVFPTRSHSQSEKKNPDSSSIFTRFHEWIAAMLLLHFLYSWLRPLGLLPMTTAAGCLYALQEGNDGISYDSLMIARDVKWPWS